MTSALKSLAGRFGGFSFVELLASAAILGLLATVAVPFVETSVKRQKERELRVALHEIRQGIDAYKQASVSGRIALGPSQSGYPPTLGDLSGGVEDLARPGGALLYFLRWVPRDPLYSGAVASAEETWGKRSYASSHDEPRPGDDVYDVYSLSTSVGLNGVPYREW